MPYPITDEARLVQLFEVLEAQRSSWFSTGRFSSQTLTEALAIVARLPNYKSEFKAALKAGTAGELDDSLRLDAIGWIDRRVEQMDIPRRVLACELTLARLKDIDDPLLRASARRLAESVPDLRDDWTAKLAPLAQWFQRHVDEIAELEAAG